MERNLPLDAFKVLLSVMVVGLHGGFLKEFPLGDFLTAQGVFRIAVPTFFVINGYYFGAVKDLKSLTGWINRVVGLYAFWMLFYVYFWFRPDSFNFMETIKLIKTIIVGHHHLWYLPGMIGAGVLTYFLRENLKLGVIVAVTSFIGGVGIQYLGNYHFFESNLLDKLFNLTFIHRNFLLLGFPFFFVGFLVRMKKLSFLSDNALFISILGAFLLVFESYFNFANPYNDGGFDNYFSLIFICPSIFVLLLNSNRTTDNKNIALVSTAIYFIHPFCMSVLRKLGFDTGTTFTFMVLALSLFASVVLIKVKDRFKVKFIL
ncbi:acyltransferase family protein [Vibrio parahaemolyticus]|uniref:acyltransferase family protein n=1 Tax=Vibrio parahaemolyticus TaxID=670 RepID=UPI0003F89A5B|nr:acyltransferase family protein [Vibrio parahaemolyticus]EJG1730946.1 acyltransferase family protein [Vibrio parahaemolyticus]MBE4085089.1 acyltransferase [Vibrio parahaemolyticus]MCA6691482.1 acyltransferase [Vibrio parahaemolyticus]MDF5585831.1 acyltransferase family protein [Vibrio parahaemolyticus]MDF5591003.1 acyltransferase family protein [Vibrio parahaemolyticus]